MRTRPFVILPALAAAILLMGPSRPAHAQVRNPDWGASDVRAQAYDNGYTRGYHEGAEDARAGRPADFRRVKEYRDGDWSYNDDRFGSRDDYRRVFRQGFEVGYLDAFEGRGARPAGVYQQRREGGYGVRENGVYREGTYGGGAYRQDVYRNGASSRVAFNYGYNDGYERGMKAARSHKAFDPNREGWYRDGDRHYDHDYGSRDVYKASYRQGFVQGYERGYRNLRGDRDDIR